MRKQAWVNTLTALILSAFIVMLRWLQNMNVFEEDTGLALRGSTLSVILLLTVCVGVVAVALLCRSLRKCAAPTEPEEAFAEVPKLIYIVLGMAAFAAAVGSVLYFLLNTSVPMRAAGLMALLSVPALLLYPLLPRWGGLGAYMSLLPVFAFSLWLVVAYREYAVNPVLWSYAPTILAVAAVLFGSYQMAGYLFYRARPMVAIFSGCLAPIFGLGILTDADAGSGRMVLGAWSVGLLALAGVLILNLSEAPVSTDEDEEDFIA